MSLRVVRRAIALAAQRAVAERGGLLVSAGFYVMVVAVLASLWRAAAANDAGSIAGYSGVALTWYIATSEAATVSLNIRLIEDTGTAITDGTIASEMLRPVSVVGLRIVQEIGAALPKLAVCVAAGATLACSTAWPPVDAGALALAVPSLLLAVAANLAAQHAFASVAFWVRDARSAWFLYQKIVFIVGGMLLPLEVLPHALERVAMFLPFMAMAYAPARLAACHFEPALLAVQVGWLVALSGAAAGAFALGERRLRMVGA